MVVVAALLLIGAAWGQPSVRDWLAETTPGRAPWSSATADTSADRIRRAFDERASNLMVTASGRVTRLLADDRDDSPHQRFIVELPNQLTLLVAHNLDLAPRVPLAVGDSVEVRGEYEWNPEGGVVHWTHDDPAGSHEPGWILHDGDRYE